MTLKERREDALDTLANIANGRTSNYNRCPLELRIAAAEIILNNTWGQDESRDAT